MWCCCSLKVTATACLYVSPISVGLPPCVAGAVSAMITQILDATQDLQAFQSLVSSYASQVAALLFPLWG